MTRNERSRMWAERVGCLQESGQPVTEWCRENGISVHTMRCWLRKERSAQPAEAPAVGWMVFNLDSPPVPEDSLIVRVGQVEIDVPERFNRQLLADILAILNPPC